MIRDYLAKECSAGRVLGPLDPLTLPQVHVNRFGVIPKGDSGKWHLIMDMSSPEGHSMNDGIQDSLCFLSYVSVDDAIWGVVDKGRGALLAKVDDRWLMGMRWGASMWIRQDLVDKIFTAVVDAVEWIVRQEGGHFVIHYLDDYLVIWAPGSPECTDALATLLGMFDRLGLPVAQDKLEGPVHVLTFLGFELDSSAFVGGVAAANYRLGGT